MIDLKKIRAIDIHTHAEEPCGCHGDDGYDELQSTMASYFRAPWKHPPTIPETAAHYREKNIAAVIDGLRGKASGIASWPDTMPFKSMVGTHQLHKGVASNQRLNMTIENLTVQGTGGLDYWNNQLAYDMEVTLEESVDGQFTVGPAMAGVRWPLQCAGSLDASVAELCTPNSDSLTKLVAQILQKELQRQGTEKLKEKGKKFLNGLFN